MSPFYSGILPIALSMGVSAIVVAWLFRVAPMAVGWKLAVSALLAGLACWAPFTAAGLMGYPLPTTKERLPPQLRLLSFAPREEQKLVDLWVVAGDGAYPIAYEIALDKQTRETLRAAGEKLARGEPVFLSRKDRAAGDAGGQGQGADDRSARASGGVTHFGDDSGSELSIDETLAAQPKN